MTQERIDLLPGEWAWEPKVNGWRALVHAPTSTVYNRHGALMSIAHEFKEALAEIQKLGEDWDFEWFDCEMLGRRHPMKKGHIFTLDYIDDYTNLYDYGVRRGRMEGMWDFEAPYAERVEVVESFQRAWDPLKMWEILQEENHRYGCDFYEGLVAKRMDSVYERQLVSGSRTTPSWVKFRFDQYQGKI